MIVTSCLTVHGELILLLPLKMFVPLPRSSSSIATNHCFTCNTQYAPPNNTFAIAPPTKFARIVVVVF